MLNMEIIRIKRSGREVSRADLSAFIRGYVKDDVTDYQMSAFLMAGFLNGFSDEEVIAMTDIMIHSGDQLDLSGIDGVKVDKHSTGGVGDKVSLILSSRFAELGFVNPMMAGRGLGHTGGTIDKLEAIEGFRAELTPEEITERCSTTGAAIFSQSSAIVPADRKLYALRDATATVESIPLITASIVSKKKSEGINGIVYDVKCGNGAFMNTREQARALAESLVRVSRGCGLKARALITDMNQVLCYTAGNALEVMEVIRFLNGSKTDKRLEDVTLELAYAAWASYYDETREEFFARCGRVLKNGNVMERFQKMVCEAGGSIAALQSIERGDFANKIFELKSKQKGVITHVDTYKVGKAVIYLGGGRRKKNDALDYTTGVVVKAAPGDKVDIGDTVFEIYYNSQESKAAAVSILERAFRVGGSYEKTDIILDHID